MFDLNDPKTLERGFVSLQWLPNGFLFINLITIFKINYGLISNYLGCQCQYLLKALPRLSGEVQLAFWLVLSFSDRLRLDLTKISKRLSRFWKLNIGNLSKSFSSSTQFSHKPKFNTLQYPITYSDGWLDHIFEIIKKWSYI